ncbi:MAG: hypothetical protein JXR48_16515 [Candidatus Delongbacteria bacterium]|nr:hypothetical protein [Candidatus Delongbacteria bacterium]MBN2836562.1 hypothetical protein [Candidatus Delongbacteria bacterium]
MRFLLILGLISCVYGFNVFNGQNHCEIKWNVFETEHIIIIYSDNIKNEAIKAASIAEATYKELSKTYKIDLDEKVKIYVSDMDDIMNGYSVMGDYIVIWTGSNEYVKYFTGRTKWLRRVISHEMSHHFLTSSIKSWIDIFLPLSITFPGEFHEGFAQYFSGEPWGFGRQDAALRAGVIENNLSTENYPGYHYATGFGMVKFLASEYGEDKLIELLKYRNDFGLYGFESAFEKVYKTPFNKFFEKWRMHLYTYYYGSFYEIGKTETDSTNWNTFLGYNELENPWAKLLKVDVKESNIFLLGMKNEKQGYLSLTKATFEKDSLKSDKLSIQNEQLLDEFENLSNFYVSENSEFIVLTLSRFEENNEIRNVVYQYNLKTDEKTRIGQGCEPAVMNNGNIFYVEGRNEDINLVYYEMGVKSIVEKSDGDEQYFYLSISNDNKYLSYIKYDKNCKLQLKLYDIETRKEFYNIELKELVKNLSWFNNQLWITYENSLDFRTSVKVFDPINKSFTFFDTPPYNVSLIDKISENENSVQFLSRGALKRSNNPLGLVTLKKAENAESKPTTISYYDKWIFQEYSNKIDDQNFEEAKPVAEYDYCKLKYIRPMIALPFPTHKGFGGVTAFMDPLMSNIIYMAGYTSYDFDEKETWVMSQWINKQFYPTFILSYTNYKFLSELVDDEAYYKNVHDLNLSASISPQFNISFTRLNFLAGISYRNESILDDKELYLFDDGDNVSLNGSIEVNYNLPFVNSAIHPVRRFEFSYNLEGSSKDLGMEKNYITHDIKINAAYSPTYHFLNNEFLTLVSKNGYEIQNGSVLKQDLIGIDNFRNIPVEDLMNNRKYVRGVDLTLTGDRLRYTNNEIWLKLTDNLGEFIGIKPELFAFQYLGVSGFYDNTILWNGDEAIDFDVFGIEAKTSLNLLGVEFIVKGGRAYDNNFKRLDDYFRLTLILPR